MTKEEKRQQYWKANLRLVKVLLLVWFVVSFVLGIFLVEPLNRFKMGGFPLGFWFAQQGSIFVFIGLVLVYARQMAKLDDAFEGQEEDV